MTDIIVSGIKGVGMWALNGIIYGSYYICLGGAIISLVLYIGGIKKAGKYITASFVLYFFLQCIKECVN